MLFRININEVRYCGLVTLAMMQLRGRHQNSCKLGSTQWNLMKRRLLFSAKPLDSYSKKKLCFFFVNELLVPHHLKRFDVSWLVGWLVGPLVTHLFVLKYGGITLFLNKWTYTIQKM